VANDKGKVKAKVKAAPGQQTFTTPDAADQTETVTNSVRGAQSGVIGLACNEPCRIKHGRGGAGME